MLYFNSNTVMIDTKQNKLMIEKSNITIITVDNFDVSF